MKIRIDTDGVRRHSRQRGRVGPQQGRQLVSRDGNRRTEGYPARRRRDTWRLAWPIARLRRASYRLASRARTLVCRSRLAAWVPAMLPPVLVSTASVVLV